MRRGRNGRSYDCGFTTTAPTISHSTDGRTIPFIGREALLKNKGATGRLKDLADAERLRKRRPADEH